MGSGCLQNTSKKNSCFTKVSDQCVVYTGGPISSLGICTGDTGGEVFEVILSKLIDYANAEGISLPDITGNCTFVTDSLANKDKNLSTLIQILFDNQCTLRQYISDIESGVEPPFSFDIGCLITPVNPSVNQIIQANITQTCKNTQDIEEIFNQLANDTTESSILNAVVELIGNKLLSQITSCQSNIIKTGSGSTAALQFVAQVPVRGMVFGDFNISSFDNDGLGLESAGMCGWHIANGKGTTVDMRGFTAAGSNASTIPGGALNPMVQPGLDIDLQNNIGSRKGAYKVTLSSSQLPQHYHVVTQNPHVHTYKEFYTSGTTGTEFPLEGVDQGGSVKFIKGNSQTTASTVDIQVGGVTGGTGVAHENRPPTYYGIWIQRIF